jgi:hypothetical protein
MKSFQGLSLALMAAALLLSFEATAVNGSGWFVSNSPYKTRNLRNLADADYKKDVNTDDDISPTKVVITPAAVTAAKDDDSVSNAALAKKVLAADGKDVDDDDVITTRSPALTTQSGSTSAATSYAPFPKSKTSSSAAHPTTMKTHNGSRNATNATHYYPQAWNSTGEENKPSNMTAFVDDDGVHGFADKVTYIEPITTLNGERLINNNTNAAAFDPREMDQPAAWPLVSILIFLLASVGLCVSTVYKRKRSGYQAVPAVTTSLVV